MALMFPKEPKLGTTSTAEILLFEEFRRQLPDSYQVYHSVAWQLRDRIKGVQDGEADFVIIEPNKGILVLEVKGGKYISYDGETDEWWSNGNKIKDPFQQGVKSKYSLLTKLKESIRDEEYFTIGNAVAFPDVEITSDIRLDAPIEIILDINKVRYLNKWVENVFKHFTSESSNKQPRLSDSVLEKVKLILSPSWKFSAPQTKYFAEQNLIIDHLTEEQFRIIDYLQRQRRVSISGCAGSGKTLVAVEKAIRLNREGFKVLFLCHNPYLADNIRSRIKGTDIKVFNFKALVDHISRGASLADAILPSNALENLKTWTQFDEPSTNQLGFAFDQIQKDPNHFDAVIVDEGQEFRDEWWTISQACLKEPDNDIFYIFFDDNQATYLFNRKVIYPVPQADIVLSRNCRNAGEIYELFKQLYPSAPSTSEELAGRGMVREWIYSSKSQLNDNLINALIEAEKYSPRLKDIIVITSEGVPSQQSEFNGSVFNSQKLIDSKEVGWLNWKKAVLNYLRPYGLPDHALTSSPYPTHEDIKRVVYFCRSKGYHSNIFINGPSIHWKMDSKGGLHLYFLQDEEDKMVSLERDILSFFADSDWIKTLPSLIMRYRLTSIEDKSHYQGYYNVRLVDIPSFKGLEADGVIFVFYNWPGGSDFLLQSSLYVALSRAKHLLFIISPFSIKEKIIELSKE